MNRAFLTKLHLVAASLMFPAVLMFLFTGALYTWGEKGAWIESSDQVALTQDFSTLSEADLREIAATALATRGLWPPQWLGQFFGRGCRSVSKLDRRAQRSLRLGG